MATPNWNKEFEIICDVSDYAMGVVDESKTHLFLSPFFKNISGLKVQFNEELWSFHPNFLFCRNLKEISIIQ